MSRLVYRIRAALMALLLCQPVGLGTSIAQAQDLSALARVIPEETEITGEEALSLRLALTQAVPWRVFTLTDPPRIVMDFREVDWTGLRRDELLRSRLTEDVRFGGYRPGWSRMVMTLSAPLALDKTAMKVDPDTGGATITARFNPVDAAGFAALSGAPRDPRWDLPVPSLTTPEKRGDRPLTVVIDPGHGGIDPGALRGDLVEKDLMLQLARAVQEALIREGETQVILTRDDDTFVPLERRVSVAHEVDADLFISLHADVLPFGRADGATIYTLAETASDEASAKLAERHDRDDLLSGVDLTGKDDVVAGVLLDLARQETSPRTAAFSRALRAAIEEAQVPLNSRAERAADFSVLKAADIPSVLIEIGYLSSERDRKNLADPDFMARVADAIHAAILAWQRADDALRPLIRQC